MNYEIRLPGFGGAGVFLRRTIAGDPLSRKAIDVWLLGPEFCNAALARPTEPDFLPDLARFLFNVAGSTAPEDECPLFTDAKAGIFIEIQGSNEDRVDLIVRVLDDPDDGPDGEDHAIDFETTRAALVHTAQGIADLAGGIDLADFGELG